jgi:tripartite-type tricarboxylate transporter receptor subunit TctC
MHGTMCYLIAAIIGPIWLASTAQATTHEFYKGKTIRIIVSVAAGGGFDTYSRTIARHMSKHIPGHPGIIVENMTGAGEKWPISLVVTAGLWLFLYGLFVHTLQCPFPEGWLFSWLG